MGFEDMPDLVFRLGGIHLTLPREAYVEQSQYGYASQPSCTSMLMSSDATIDGKFLWILGLSFFRQFVVEFVRSRTPPQVGFAAHPGGTGPTASHGGGGECPSQPRVANTTQLVSEENRQTPSSKTLALLAPDSATSVGFTRQQEIEAAKSTAS